MHPEYPSGHSILAAAVAAVLQADAGTAMPVLSSSSPTANGATRQWHAAEDFVREVGDARVWGGLHYRFSVDTAAAMGRRIGALAADRLLTPAH